MLRAGRGMTRGLPSCIAALLVLAVASADAFESRRRVLAEFPFLHPDQGEGPLYRGYIRIDLSSRPHRPLPMLLDTGASWSVMTPRYARALRVPVRKHRNNALYSRSTVLGRDLEFRVDTRSSDTPRTGWEYGLLGANFLRPYVIEIDYTERRVYFLDRKDKVSEEQADPGEWILPMGFTDGRPTVEIQIGEGSAQFVMDTGARSEIVVSEEKARELGIEIPPDAETVITQNVIGKARSASFFLPRVRVGGHDVENVVLRVALREGSTHRTTNISDPDQAYVGNPFLSRFRVRLGYPNGKVGLLPRVTPPPPAEVSELADATGPTFVRVDLSPARAAVRYEQTVWLELASPVEQQRLEGPVDWVEVQGWAGAGQRMEHDVVVIVDISGSTAYASGADVDGDGRVGRVSRRNDRWRSVNPARLSSDDGDTVLAAETLATQRLIERLNPRSTRVGVIAFANTARIDAPLGSNRERLKQSLDRLSESFGSGMTNMAEAIDLATVALLAARLGDEPDRTQSIILLSDGYPTTPKDPEDAAYEAAHRAARSGIRIHTFALGLGELKKDDVFVEMAFASGGSHVRVENPAEIVHELSRIRLTDLASLEVVNLSTGSRGRATRVFPDGSFDSLVQLAPGLNRIQIEAIGDDGGRTRAVREVFYERRHPTDSDAEELESFLEKLRIRTIETRMAGEAARDPQQSPGERRLKIEPD